MAIAATAARLACLPATARITRVVAPQQLQQRPAAKAKEELEEEAANTEESFHVKRGGGQISSHTRAQKGYLLRTISGSSPKKVVQERNNGTDLESCRVPP